MWVQIRIIPAILLVLQLTLSYRPFGWFLLSFGHQFVEFFLIGFVLPIRNSLAQAIMGGHTIFYGPMFIIKASSVRFRTIL